MSSAMDNTTPSGLQCGVAREKSESGSESESEVEVEVVFEGDV